MSIKRSEALFVRDDWEGGGFEDVRQNLYLCAGSTAPAGEDGSAGWFGISRWQSDDVHVFVKLEWSFQNVESNIVGGNTAAGKWIKILNLMQIGELPGIVGINDSSQDFADLSVSSVLLGDDSCQNFNMLEKPDVYLRDTMSSGHNGVGCDQGTATEVAASQGSFQMKRDLVRDLA